MTLRLVDTHRAASLIRRRGAIVMLTVLAVAAVVALAALGIAERHAAVARAAKTPWRKRSIRRTRSSIATGGCSTA